MVCVVSVSTCTALEVPSAVTVAPLAICALVSPTNTAAPTAPARAVPPAEKLAAGSSINISVSSPACSFTDPKVAISAAAPIFALVTDLINPTLTEPAPARPPVDPAIPTTVAVRFCSVSAATTTLLSATTTLLMPARTSFQNTFAPRATPTEVLLLAASVPVRSVMLLVSLTTTPTDCDVDALMAAS